MAEQSSTVSRRPQGRAQTLRRKPTPRRGVIQRITKDDAPVERGLVRKAGAGAPPLKSSPPGDAAVRPRRTIRRVAKDDAPPQRGLIKRIGSEDEAPPERGLIRRKSSKDAEGKQPKKRVVKRRVVKKGGQEVTPEEQENLKLEEDLTEEQKLQREKEEAEKKAEEERLLKEKEEAEKKAEEERLQKEKEEAERKAEEERVRQEQERQRIFNKIEFCMGPLDENERQKALTIADEMVKRNVKWHGYISLNSGIGGSMLL